MEYKDYYKILGVDRNASEEVIKRTYRKLARQLHPDVNPGDEAAESRFKGINEAYQVLGDPEKRAKYDRLGSSWNRWQQAGHDPSSYDWSQWTSPGGAHNRRVRIDLSDLDDLLGGGMGGFSSFFDALFGGGAPGARRASPHNRPTRGRDIEQPVEISLEEAYSGTMRTLDRGGSRMQAKIPPGASTGTRVRLAGQGAPNAAGVPGDLYLRISVKPHPHIQRKEDDLHVETPVDLYTAVLGGEASVETMDGTVQLKIPAGTQSGQVFRLRGKGMPNLRQKERFGDLYAKVLLQIPQELSDREKKLFQELAALRKR
jgi:curved DNA-binding protein